MASTIRITKRQTMEGILPNQGPSSCFILKHRIIKWKQRYTIVNNILYSQNIDMINFDPNDLLEQLIDKEPELYNEDSFDEIEEKEQEEFRYDWIYLAELGSNTYI